ncbi:hypothetical protein J0J30_22695, partial [Vibrio vulnificus]|nr:hypothetical protein [Vibrio vulnificus]
FREKGIYDVLGHEDVIYEDLVREFYVNMHVNSSGDANHKTVLSTRVKCMYIVVNEQNLCRWFAMSPNGVRATCSNEDKSMERTRNPDDSDDEPEPEQEWTFNLEEGYHRVCQLMVVESDKEMEAMDMPIGINCFTMPLTTTIFPERQVIITSPILT